MKTKIPKMGKVSEERQKPTSEIILNKTESSQNTLKKNPTYRKQR